MAVAGKRGRKFIMIKVEKLKLMPKSRERWKWKSGLELGLSGGGGNIEMVTAIIMADDLK